MGSFMSLIISKVFFVFNWSFTEVLNLVDWNGYSHEKEEVL